ncbi:MAG: cytochrome P450 [Pseudomonadota bacterium]
MSASIDQHSHSVPVATSDIQHIPGERGLPLLGHLPELLRNPRGLRARMHDTYGPVFKTRVLGQWTVNLNGVDALQMVMQDREHNFSSEQGWDHTIGKLFKRGLMLLDFDEHRYHRRILQTAFKSDALAHYLDSMQQVARQSFATWSEQSTLRVYPAIKQLALDNAAVAFLGIELDARADSLNQAFIDTVTASLAVVRWPIPGLAYQRGLKGRALLHEFFASQIAERRTKDASDMFTLLCQASNDDGEAFSDEDIINHMIFLLMAAHDTVTSSLTIAIHGLAAHPQWQERLRAENAAVGDGPLDFAQLDQLEQTGWLFNEALRLWGPVPLLPRRALRAFQFADVEIPANTQIAISPDSAHYDASVWSNPTAFDPERFSPARAEHKQHAFAFCPYGGGAHKCIGMRFAQMLAKVVLREFVTTFDCTLTDGYALDMQPLPIPKPRDGLPVRITRR